MLMSNSKFVNPLFKNIFKRFALVPNFIRYNFSTIKLMTRDGHIDRSENPNFNINLNWELSKVWVNPQNNSYRNSQPANKSYSNDTSEDCKIASVGPKIQQIDFDRFLRKIGLNISREDEVFIQEGTYKGKNVRIISDDKDDAAICSAILDEIKEIKTPEFHVLYVKEMEEVQEKRFAFYYKKAKAIITNTKNLDNVVKIIDEIEKASTTQQKQ
jgi:hypothetical protein